MAGGAARLPRADAGGDLRHHGDGQEKPRLLRPDPGPGAKLSADGSGLRSGAVAEMTLVSSRKPAVTTGIAHRRGVARDLDTFREGQQLLGEALPRAGELLPFGMADHHGDRRAVPGTTVRLAVFRGIDHRRELRLGIAQLHFLHGTLLHGSLVMTTVVI